MVSATTNGITVIVKTNYRIEESAPLFNRFIHTYEVRIENGSDTTFQLLSRHWYIRNGIGEIREVIGEGVVGKQPVIAPGYAFQYESFSVLATPLGYMWGNYTLRNLHDQSLIQVAIPEFTLEALTLQN